MPDFPKKHMSDLRDSAIARKRIALIIGGGPAGLTAAYELITRSDIHPIVIERDPVYVGGISRTVLWEGNRIDLGGHRFFSKSDRVMQWWSTILPVDVDLENSPYLSYHRATVALTSGMKRATASDGENVMRVHPRKTRIFYDGKLFTYPVELSADTFFKLGVVKSLRIGATYMHARLFPRKPERTLEDFFINRFGDELYKTFFKSYTEKVWGKSCSELSAEWGAQRIKTLSLSGAVAHAFKKVMRMSMLSRKSVETSLIEQFLYPVYGPGQLWERVAELIREKGGEVRLGTSVAKLHRTDAHITHATLVSERGEERVEADFILSSTDIRALSEIVSDVPKDISTLAHSLEYRDFLTVGLLLDQELKEKDGSKLLDTWIYVHDPRVSISRIQLYNNWSSSLVAKPGTGWIGIEYHCAEDSRLWNMKDDELIALAGNELKKIDLLGTQKILGGVVIRQPKAYPSYSGTYARFGELREYFDRFSNLFLMGRNGMHRYNNQDYSMLTAMETVDGIISGTVDKERLWSINTEEEYHESSRKA